MRWLWGRWKVSRKRDEPVRRSDPVPESLRQQRLRTIDQCETLSRHIDAAHDLLDAATADLAGHHDVPMEAWMLDVVQAIERVQNAANLLNCLTPPGRQLPYRYLKRIRSQLADRDAPEPVTVAQFGAYQEALSTLRRDTERLHARLVSDNEVPSGAD